MTQTSEQYHHTICSKDLGKNIDLDHDGGKF